MDDISDLPGSSDTTSGDPTPFTPGPSEGVAQETMSAASTPLVKDSEVRFLFCIANYITNQAQNKTSEEIAAILRQWHEVKERYDQTKSEDDVQYTPECTRVFGEYGRHQTQHAVRVALLPYTIDSSQTSTARLDILNQAIFYDQKANMATWTLYEAQKKAVKCRNAFEELCTFCLEHFILDEVEEQELREEIISLASSRRSLREMGPRIVTLREYIMNLVKGRR
jgi:hypothetical protein